MLKLLSVGLLLAHVASADTRWTQVPGRPVWVSLPTTWSVVGDPDRAAFTATNPRGGVLTCVVAPAADSNRAAAREWDLLASGYRGVEAPRIDAKGLHGLGRIGEATFALDVVDRTLDVSALKAVEPLTLIVATAIPESVAKDLKAILPEIKASVRVQWERPGGGYTTVPGTTIQVREPDAGYRTRVAGDTVYVGSVDGSVELQASYKSGTLEVASLLDGLKGALAPPSFSWTTKPFAIKGVAGKGGMIATSDGVVDEVRYSIQLVGLPVSGGVVVVILNQSQTSAAPADKQVLAPDIGKSLRVRP